VSQIIHAVQETLVTCPDAGWITVRIQRHRWTPALWEGNVTLAA
jgi:hypothetical protein